ncbi:MAG: YerC/YecD family TrpR-related protein [Patescibacteria group bacterium]|nr:YerC/YecD family TrpR-related protein [Patescibacteria group bacterium]
MAKIIPQSISKSERNKLKSALYTKIAQLSNKNMTEEFFDDLLTESEILMLVRRLQIAKMLLDGHIYYAIRKELGVGYENIRSVRLSLDNGSESFLKFIKELKI